VTFESVEKVGNEVTELAFFRLGPISDGVIFVWDFLANVRLLIWRIGGKEGMVFIHDLHGDERAMSVAKTADVGRVWEEYCRESRAIYSRGDEVREDEGRICGSDTR
jgi:hypothetical protein